MRLSRRRRSHSAVEASSLADILFFLMLFFLMISTMASPNAIKLLLPNARTTQHTPQKKVKVSIDAAGIYYIEKEPVAIDAMQARLIQVIGNDKETSIVLHADQTATMEEVIKVVDIANQMNVPLVVATQHPK